MGSELKKIECDPKCGFMAVSHDEKELVDIGKEHGKNFHDMTLSEEEIREMIKPA